MSPFSFPFSNSREPTSEFVDDRESFVPEHLPEPGPFLAGQDVLTDDEHVAVHEVAHDCFEERGVYDATFGYNLAILNRDRRHPKAGYRYAIETGTSGADGNREGTGETEDGDGAKVDRNAPASDEPFGLETPADYRVLRAEFTPTTEFCPQGSALTTGSFRAWNGLADRHEFDLVRVRVHPSHYQAGPINAELAALEEAFLESGEIPDDPTIGRNREAPI